MFSRLIDHWLVSNLQNDLFEQNLQFEDWATGNFLGTFDWCPIVINVKSYMKNINFEFVFFQLNQLKSNFKQVSGGRNTTTLV